jgi:WXG100 family type VII secretion target
MGANLNVTFDDMEKAAIDLADGQSDIEGKLLQLKNGIDGLVNGGYVTDKSSKAFDQSYTEFNDGVKKTIEGLDGMGQYLKQAAKALAETDEQLAQAINKG